MAQLQLKCNKGTFYPNIYTLNKGQVFDKIKILKTGTAPYSMDITSSLSRYSYSPNKQYELKVLYRCRGNGSSSTSNCSTIGYRSTWVINNTSSVNINDTISSSDAYPLCNGHFICKHYKITLPQCNTASLASFKLVWSIDNNDSKKDGQTLDLYYYSIYDYTKSKLAESGIYGNIYEFSKNNNIYVSIPYTAKTDVPIQLGMSYPTKVSLDYVKGVGLSGTVYDLNTGTIIAGRAYQKEIKYPCNVKIYLKDNYSRSLKTVTYYNNLTEEVWNPEGGERKYDKYTGWYHEGAFETVNRGQVLENSFDYNDPSDGKIYLYVNGSLINSGSNDLDGGKWFDIGYCKPGTIITVRYCYYSSRYVYDSDYIASFTKNTEGTYSQEFFTTKIDEGHTEFGNYYLGGSSDFVNDKFGSSNRTQSGNAQIQIDSLESPEDAAAAAKRIKEAEEAAAAAEAERQRLEAELAAAEAEAERLRQEELERRQQEAEAERQRQEELAEQTAAARAEEAEAALKLSKLCPFGTVSEEQFSNCSIAKGHPAWVELYNGATCKYGLTPKSCGYIKAAQNINIGCPLYHAVAICPNHQTMHENCIWKEHNIYNDYLDEYGNYAGRKSVYDNIIDEYGNYINPLTE